MKSKLLFFLAVTTLFPLLSIAQTTSVLRINSSISKANPVATSLASSNDDGRFLFELNDELFEEGLVQKGSRIAVEIAAGEERVLEITRVSNYMPGTTSYIARDPNDASRTFAFTYNESGVQGIFHDSYASSLTFTKDLKRGLNFVETTSNEDVLVCHTDEEHNEIVESFLGLESVKSKTANIVQSTAASIDDEIVIDLLLEVTTNAVTWALGSNAFADINEVLAQAMNLSQSALDNSSTGIELRVVLTHTIELTAEEQVLPTVDKRNRLQAGSGSFLETRMLRDEYGADLVALIDEIFDTGGIAFVPTTPFASPATGFSVNRVQQVGSGFTLIHEIGHDMGNFHSRTQTRGPGPSKGGALHFSVGIQDFDNAFASIMGDGASGFARAPVFASPDIIHRQVPTGIDRPIDPINSGLTLKLLKGVVASYRPTVELPPVPGITASSIDIELGTGEEASMPVTITNTGESRLNWSLDFVSPENLIETDVVEEDAEVIYNTSFEFDEGFIQLGSFPGISNWTTLSGFDNANNQVEISELDPSEGNQHLQLSFTNLGSSRTATSPYFGSQPLARYEISFDLRIANVLPGDIETRGHTVFVRDTESSKIVAGIRIQNGNVSSWGAFPGFPAVGEYQDTGVSTGFQAYRNVRFVMNPETQRIEYYLDNVLIAENDYVTEANSPDQIFFEFGNEFQGSSMSVDEVLVTSTQVPYTWLDPDAQTGSVAAGEEGQVMLDFSAENLTPGVYETTMILFNNSAETPQIEVPVTLTVNLSVSNEDETNIPTEIALDQNFPNPFNPTTNITFRLNSTSEVNLVVFNTLGQQVATITQGRFAAGSHTVPFDASSLASGVYVYQLQAGNTVLNRKLTLIK